MFEQLLDRRIAAGQFRLGEDGVNFTVADGMEDGHQTVFAALELGNEMMLALHLRRNGAPAKGANLPIGLAAPGWICFGIQHLGLRFRFWILQSIRMENFRPLLPLAAILALVALSGCRFLHCDRCVARQEAARVAAVQKYEEEQRQIAAAEAAAAGHPVVPGPVTTTQNTGKPVPAPATVGPSPQAVTPAVQP